MCVYEALLDSGQTSWGERGRNHRLYSMAEASPIWSHLSYTPRLPIAPRCSLGQYYRQGNAFRQSWSLRISRLRRKSDRVPCGTDGQQATITRSFRAVCVWLRGFLTYVSVVNASTDTHTNTDIIKQRTAWLLYLMWLQPSNTKQNKSRWQVVKHVWEYSQGCALSIGTVLRVALREK